MALKLTVKINSVTNLSDARYCAGMGVELIGFSIDKNSPNYIDPLRFREISGWISGVSFVGEYNGANPSELMEILENYSFDFIQLSENFPVSELPQLQIPYFITSSIDSKTIDLLNYRSAKLLILKLSEINSEVFKLIDKFAVHFDVLLEGNINQNDLIELMANTRIKGLSLNGGQEIKPGLKDYSELSEILESLEIED